MKIKREWATPITAGAFLLSAVTGVLMFFHWDTGLNKVAHEWLSWALLGGVGFHLAVNFPAFKRYFSARGPQMLMGSFAVVLALSFIPVGGESEPAFAPALKALAQAPLSTVAQVAAITPEEMVSRLSQQGIAVESHEQTVQQLVGDDLRTQIRTLTMAFSGE